MENNKSVVINYKMADGTNITLTVPIRVAEAIIECENKEKALLKQDKRHLCKIVLEDCAEYIASNEEDVISRIIQKETTVQVHAALSVLTETQRRRVYMHYFQNLSYRQIADIENVRFTTVAESVDFALQKLKKHFRY